MSGEKRFYVLLSRCFRVVGFFFHASDFFLRVLLPLRFKDLAIAASARASSRFENMTSPKVFDRGDRKRLNEYCESSQRTITFSVVPYSPVSFVGKLISAVGLVAVPYFADIVRTMESAVSPSVTYRS